MSIRDTRAPRVVIVQSTLGIGGTELEAARLIEALDGQVSPLVAPLADLPSSIPQMQPKAPTFSLCRRTTYDPFPIRTLAQLIRRKQPSFIISFDRHSMIYSLLARLVARANVPLLARTLEAPGVITRSAVRQLRIARHLIRPTDRVLALSETLRQYFLRLSGFPEQQVMVLRLGIDTARFSPASEQQRLIARRELGLDSGAPTLAIIARLLPIKQHEFAFRVVRALVDTGLTKIRLLVVGGGEPAREASLRAEAKRLGLEEQILFCGAQPDVVSHLAASDVILLTSRAEATPMVVIEALAAGRPVVATRLPGVVEQLGPMLERYAIPDTSFEIFVETTRRLLLSSEERAVVGRLGRAHVEQEWSKSRWAAQYRNLIRCTAHE